MEKVKVIGCIGETYLTPKYLDRLDGPIKHGDWIVYNGIVQKYDLFFELDKQIFDINQLIKVKQI